MSRAYSAFRGASQSGSNRGNPQKQGITLTGTLRESTCPRKRYFPPVLGLEENWGSAPEGPVPCPLPAARETGPGHEVRSFPHSPQIAWVKAPILSGVTIWQGQILAFIDEAVTGAVSTRAPGIWLCGW